MPAADDVGKEMATVAPTDDATEADQSGPRASLAELYQFASAFEKLVLAVAVVGALGAGASMPMMLIAFGGAFDQLGVAETVPGQSVLGSFMDTMLLQFVYVGIGMGGGKLIYVACVQYVCSAQILKYKVQFLKAVLRQDVAWYDSSSPEELTTKFESSMVKVKKGLSASAFLLFEGLGYGLGSLILGFYYQWAVSLITFATVPLLIIPASYAMHIVEKGGQVQPRVSTPSEPCVLLACPGQRQCRRATGMILRHRLAIQSFAGDYQGLWAGWWCGHRGPVCGEDRRESRHRRPVRETLQLVARRCPQGHRTQHDCLRCQCWDGPFGLPDHDGSGYNLRSLHASRRNG